ncbi:uncharacterized protein LOC127804711 isoform X2 [Diospyros lotus]|uniref:uncharacterized protein LOC127804711 isoform X2 n=1 Tax=Diospyros lotus TaxID=55363 RepID=UPI00225288D9|nr:uncharacterized protein LOC127804711 isoform X2 [Diospyros lotus]
MSLDMDSGNSGSIQSSSGGDEEYDSRAESFSAFLNPTAAHIAPMTNPPPPPSHHHPNSSIFDPLSNLFDPLSRTSPPPPLNLDAVWCKNLRSAPNCTEMNPMLVQPFFGSQAQPRGCPPPNVPFSPAAENTTPRASQAATTGDQAHAVRNPKKRSRASRRAPTTVLTTDTTNFRAMVQEFTGIPAPPFTSSPFPRSRFDLFGAPSSMRSGPLDAAASQPPYLLRPFAQKFQPPPPPFVSSSSPNSTTSLSSSFLSSSLVDGININPSSTTTTNNILSSGTSTTSAVSHSTSLNYQLLPSDLGILKQTQGLLMNMQQSPILAFQPFLQSAPKYPLSSPNILGSKTPADNVQSSNDSHLKMGGLGEFNPTQIAGLPNLVSSEGATARNDSNPESWADGAGSDASHLRSVNGNYDYLQQGVNNGKLNNNYSVSSSNFHADKGSQNVPARGEGKARLK